jgi:hypothetical protein
MRTFFGMRTAYGSSSFAATFMAARGSKRRVSRCYLAKWLDCQYTSEQGLRFDLLFEEYGVE